MSRRDLSDTGSFWVWWIHPSVIFIAFSIVFGTSIIALTPPLRAPDEAAHFLRAYGIAQGDIIPSTRDGQGRKGIFLPARLYDGFAYFEAVQAKERKAFGSRAAIEAGPQHDASVSHNERLPVTFVLYEGSEGYTPVPYLPYIAAVLIARLFDLEFTGTLYLMRVAGFATMTGVLAGAIALSPFLGWSFLAISMLPAALYGRAVVSADGATFAYTLMIIVLCLRGAAGFSIRTRHHALWMTLCVLSKPPHVVFILLELMRCPFALSCRGWT